VIKKGQRPESRTAIPRIFEDRETVFNGFQYQFITGKPLKSLKLTLDYYEKWQYCKTAEREKNDDNKMYTYIVHTCIHAY
jgi:hypothetical protein